MTPSPLKLCVVTGSRAEYGLFFPLMTAIRKQRGLQLQIIATGMHLSPEFGLTFQQIEKDGFSIDEKVEMLLSADTDTGTIKSVGVGLIGLADSFQRLRPDWVILLGDRFETFAAASAAHLLKIPIAHLHGGELTEGATDDAMRHAISKMSYLHFTSTEAYRRRVIQLGEHPKRVFNAGAIGLDNIQGLKLYSKSKLEKELDFSINEKTILVTFHPVTLENNTATQQFGALLHALDKNPDLRIVFTLPNADANGRAIIKMIEAYTNVNPGRTKAFPSLGQLRYLSALQYVAAVVGNSSSGIVEVPSFKIPTVNIGDRQTGRIKAASVIDAKPTAKSILQALQQAFSPSFVSKCRKTANPYFKKEVAAGILKTIIQTGRISSIKKPFYDLPS